MDFLFYRLLFLSFNIFFLGWDSHTVYQLLLGKRAEETFLKSVNIANILLISWRRGGYKIETGSSSNAGIRLDNYTLDDLAVHFVGFNVFNFIVLMWFYMLF